MVLIISFWWCTKQWVVPNTPLYSLNIIQRNMQVRLSCRSNPSSLHDFVSPIWWWNIPDSIKLGENTWPHSCLTQNNSISVHESMQPKVSEMKCTWQFSTNWNYYWPDWWDRKASNKQTKKCTFLFIQSISINRTQQSRCRLNSRKITGRVNTLFFEN